MKSLGSIIVGLFAAAALLASFGCSRAPSDPVTPHPIVGAWLVKEPAAPFPYHMYVFNADGTMQQANPDAGHANTSDSDGKGIWVADGQKIKGKWVEVIADRSTRQYIGRGELSYEIEVSGNTFSGPAVFRAYDAKGALVDAPLDAPLTGERVTLP